MRKIFGIIGLHFYVIGCATPAPVEEPQAVLQKTEDGRAIEAVIDSQPAPLVQGFVCRPVADKVPAETIESLGFRVKQLQIIEDGESAELIVERLSLVGDIPLRSLHFPSTRYNIDGEKRYGEWEHSEHWVRLGKTTSGYQGRFVYESEFSIPIACD